MNAVSMGIAMSLEESWGGDITTAAIAHLAHSTPEKFRLTRTDVNSYITVSTAPGMGITSKMDVLGKRVLEIS